MSPVDLQADMAAVAARVESELDRLLEDGGGAQARLVQAMRYAALGGGKRLRAYLVSAAARLFEVGDAAATRVGAAIELLHAYSLIHDDLPAMDDATLRRGKPACHLAFDEATAILAGDALQAMAFEALAGDGWGCPAAIRAELCAGLARAAGLAGMCGGQMIDLEAETRTLDLAAITELQALKTGALIGFACEAGAMLGGADAASRAALLAYAARLGLAFQIKDDLLDLTGDAAVVGKDVGRDNQRSKATFPGLLGIDGAVAELERLRRQAETDLDSLARNAIYLKEVFRFVINREL